MKKINIFIILLVIWNIALTAYVFISKNTNTTITEENVSGFSTDLTKVAEESKSSVVVVESSFGRQSGFIYKQQDDKAYIVTTFHGIGDSDVASITFLNGKTFIANIEGYDFKSDIAVLSIEVPYKLNVAKCGDNEFLKAGEFIINIGTSADGDYINDIQLGVISNSLISINDNVTYDREKYSFNKEVISISLNIKEGYSGSPILNMNNEVVGMVEMSNDNNGIYAITVNEIKLVVDSIINKKEINKLNLGISGDYIKTLKEYERNMYALPLDVSNGYYVKTVYSSSIASKLGLVNGDIIININDKAINNQKDLLNILYGENSNELSLSVVRNNEYIELKGLIND